MQPEFFGDSYDFVKREIIRGLAPAKEWAVHPMYFARYRRQLFVDQYTRFLGIGLVEGPICDRRKVSAVGKGHQNHLLLDPDTGLWIPGAGGVKPDTCWRNSKKHLKVDELVAIAQAKGRERKLTLVYDQSYTHAYNSFEKRREEVKKKLKRIREVSKNRVHSAAYVSHAVFIWVSADERTLYDATRRLRTRTRTPVTRIVGLGL